ncbi:MAG: phosphatidylglycerophosphatase A [Aquificaceae bacterium]|nr:phosphatidylglycerophosphatase A [Aquificaceae bacterium]MCS7307616.1 phosphatidylglycerophosphatase A [Aquificaceae bacterium]MCX8075988.1 phosphatidylglycerophosphatase A [Aquificaceae bacterium]MDW8095848.1 phosphatidylglycerophosphatase A [Aquificaceae bacterium]MDW8433815.1 phosphatidylglycerophosphatase A [Aquificaceae bacterium]
MTFRELIATGFYVGKLGYAPGTLGTLLGIPLLLLIHGSWLFNGIFALLLYWLAVWSANYMVELKGEKDPEEVVIDEVLGYFVSFLFVEPTLKAMIVGFVTFRALDILKPYPIRLFERLPRGHGVVADDAVAGLVNSLLLYFLLR